MRFYPGRCDEMARWRILGCMSSRFLAIDVEGGCLRAAAAGDREAQREVYELCAAPVFALVRRLVPGRAAAEDVFQDCMITLLDHLGDYRGDAPFGAWLRQVATRHCLMHLRSPWQRARRALHWGGSEDQQSSGVAAGRSALTLAAVPSVDPPMADIIDLERALARLPHVARTVVWLHEVEGLKHEEIAAMFGRSVSFSKSQLARAHVLLRAELGDHAPAAPMDDAALAAEGQVP